MTVIHFTVNSVAREIAVEPRMTLADALRGELGLTGTHLGCEQGACGACTVILDGACVRSCLMFAVQAEGAHVETVEALSTNDQLHPLQKAFLEARGFQCGFCTPGMLLTVVQCEREGRMVDRGALLAKLSANICRCTGYEPIITAASTYLKSVGRWAPEEDL